MDLPKSDEIGDFSEMVQLKLKRIYQEAAKTDGMRILIDGLWPRGIKKSEAKIDLWLKEIAPSPELRGWFHHELEKWPVFCKRYHEELSLKQEPVQYLLAILKEHPIVTFLYGAKEETYNNAVALKSYLEPHIHQDLRDK